LESVIIRKALDLGLKVNITERASSNLKYENYTISPHYQPEWWDKARSFWEESQPIDTFRRQQINQYLELKSNGFDSFLGQKWSEFYVNQIQDFAEFRPYIVFFTTSTHEYSPIIEYESKLGFSNQFEAAKLLKLVCEEFGYNLIVRRHPNSLSPLDKRDREGIHWDKLSGANTVIFGPKDSVNSIELAKNSHVAFVWRSSVGIETLFRGVPTFALGSARWALDESVRAWSKEKIRKVISNSAQDSNSILEIYANYMANGGQQLKYFVNVNRDFAISNLGDRLYMYLGDRFSIAFRYSVRKFLYRNIRRKA
jgi:hypothetical protein